MPSHGSCRAWIAGLVCCAALAAGAAPATAAQALGGSISRADDLAVNWEGCGATPTGCAYAQVSLDNVDAARASQSGVITSWRAKGDDFGATGTGTGALFLADLDQIANTVTRSVTSALAAVTPTAPVHLVRIPVVKDQIVGLFTSEDTSLASSPILMGSGHDVAYWKPALAPGIADTSAGARSEILGFEAKVEPDADNDGYGDETQDKCPAQVTPASPGGACPPVVKPPGPIVAPAFTALPSVKTVTQGKASQLVFKLTKAGTVEGKLEKATVGRKSGKTCVKQTRKNKTKKRCTRYVKSARTKTLTGAAGANSKSLGKLRAGSYRITLTPSLSGVKGKVFKVFFKVKPKPKKRKR